VRFKEDAGTRGRLPHGLAAATAGEFKSKCLAVMDEVLESGEPVLITKRGKPVAKLVAAREKSDEIFGYMTGKARIVGDIIHSAPAEDWKPR
jgi:prevent-host-death family protein